MNKALTSFQARGRKLVRHFYTRVQKLTSKRALRISQHGARERKSFSLFVHFSSNDQTLFAKRLSFLVKAGVPMLESLHLIRKQTTSPAKGKIFDALIHDVSNGQYLSTSLYKFRNLFGDFTINLIRIGETSGVLSQNLLYLAEELEKKQTLKRKVMGALIYPAVITIATLGVTSMITVYIFPKIMPIFTSLHVDLPMSTRILMGVSTFLSAWGLWCVAGLVVSYVFFLYTYKTYERVRYISDRTLLRIPLAGALVRSYNLANITRTLGLLLRSGLYLSESMLVVAETTNNRVYRAACETMSGHILKGEPLSRGFEAHRAIFPDTLSHMVSIGEATGNLPGSLMYLSDLYEGEVEDLTKGLSAAIEPILMVIMGLLVGIIAVSVITPIYSITQHVTPR